MSEALDPNEPVYAGKNDLDLLLHVSAEMMDSEREFQPRAPGVGYSIEWDDAEGRQCSLTSEVIPDEQFIGQTEGLYAYTRYIFNRRDVVENTERTYNFQTNTDVVDRYDGDMNLLTQMRRRERKVAIKSIIESYRGHLSSEILKDHERELFVGIVQNYKATAEHPIDPPLKARLLTRALKGLFS